MEKTIRVFRSHEEARQFNAREMAKLTPDERVGIALALHAWYYRDDPSARRLARVYRVVRREPR
jgi:hypothetical protein